MRHVTLPLTEENVEKAFCNVLACTGIGAAEGDCDGLRPQRVWVVVPDAMHIDYTAKLLACANKVCGHKPYEWTVVQEEPKIDDDTTFDDLWNGWFVHIIYS